MAVFYPLGFTINLTSVITMTNVTLLFQLRIPPTVESTCVPLKVGRTFASQAYPPTMRSKLMQNSMNVILELFSCFNVMC